MEEKRTKVVAEFILDNIRKGKFKVGDKIPSERELGEILNLGRSSIREATSSLVDMNVLEKRMGIGIFVKKTEFNALVDNYVVSSLINSRMSLDLLEFRLMLEIQIVEKAAKIADSKDFKKMILALDMQKDAIINQKPSIESDLLFHRSIVISTKNVVLLKVYDSISDLLRTVREELLIIDPEEKSLDFHKNIFKAIRNRDSDEAKYWMEKHLRDVIKSYEILMKKKCDEESY